VRILERARKSRFLRDSATLQVATLFNSFGNLASTLALAHVLGARRQGEYLLAVASWSFLWFTVNLGLVGAVTSQVAAAAARGQRAKAAAWLAWLAKSSFVLGLGAVLLAWLVLPPVCGWTYGNQAVGRLAALLGTQALVEIGRLIAGAGLQGTRNMRALARVENAQEFLRVTFVVAGALVTGSALGPVLGSLCASLCASGLAIDVWRREARRAGATLPGLRETLAHLPDVPLAHGMRLGLRLGLVRNIDAYGVQILPAVILGAVGNEASVTYLRIAQRLTDVARSFMQGINRTALPHFSEIVGLREPGRLPRAYWRATAFSGCLISTGLLASLPLVPLVIGLYPADYHEPAWTMYRILVPGVMIVSFSVANDTFYLVTNTLRVGMALSVLGLVVNTTVVALLASAFPRLGVAYGLSFTFTWSLTHILFAAWWFRRHRASVPAGGPGAPDVSQQSPAPARR